MTDHPYPVGLRVHRLGDRATVMQAEPGAPYVVLLDRPARPRLVEWPRDAVTPIAYDRDFAHDIEATGNGLAACSCGMTGTERLAAEHARAYDMCGECWGGGTDAYPCLGLCRSCGGSGTREDEERMAVIYDKAEAEIDASLEAEEKARA